jgi:acyl-CoA thioesterase II
MAEEKPLEHAVRILNLSEISKNGTVTSFEGENLPFPTERIYGGQIMAQAIMAAAKTTPDSRVPNSVHGYYIRTGVLSQNVNFVVNSLRDGRSYSTRQVEAYQPDRSILETIVSFQESGQPGIEYADAIPQGLPDPEELQSAEELMRPYASKSAFADYYVNQSPFDIRHITPTIMLKPDNDSHKHDNGRQLVWLRANGHMELSQKVQRSLLALGCDQLMMEPALRRSGLSITTPGISYASLDHSMWWYHDVDVCSWLLFVQDSTVASHGRALCTAKVYDQKGTLVSAMSQEAMIRVPDTLTNAPV